MKRLGLILTALTVAALAMPAGAGWVQKNNISAGGRLLGDGADLLYLAGTSLKKYDPATDTWSDQASCPAAAQRRVYIGGDKFAVLGNNDRVHVYDIGDNAWSTSTAGPPVVSGWWNWQGLSYDPTNDKVIVSWSDSLTGYPNEEFYSAAYDAGSDSWGSRYDYCPSSTVDNVWVGDTVYRRINNYNVAVSEMSAYDSTQGGDWGTGTWVNTASFDLANDTSTYESITYPTNGSEFGTKMMATGPDGKIYITGVDWSNCFIVYDPATDTWEYPQEYFPAGPGGYRDHSVEVADGVLYRHQFNELWAYELPSGEPIPEPATLGLLAAGGLGVLLRRRRRA